jgi:hypothetical protein
MNAQLPLNMVLQPLPPHLFRDSMLEEGGEQEQELREHLLEVLDPQRVCGCDCRWVYDVCILLRMYECFGV